MSYPQPEASQESLEGQEFYRLKTLLESSGDAYEMNVSAKAFAIGPESDIARARVTYLDPIHGAHSFLVAVGAPFISRVDAQPKKLYPGGVPGNIIITPEDLIEPVESMLASSALALGYTAGRDLVGFIKPRLDLIGYMSVPSIIPDRRADITHRGLLSVHNHLADDFTGSGTTRLFVPYYRRKYASFKINCDVSGSVDYTFSIKGVSFLDHALTSDLGVSRLQVSSLVTGGVSSGGTAAPEVRASLHGMWDYLAITVAGPSVDSGDIAASGHLSYTLDILDEEI